MQRLGDGFLVKRMIPMPASNGGSVNLYELPNGQWQFGKGRDATVVTSLDQVKEVTDQNALNDIARWIERTKGAAVAPVVDGPRPVLAGLSARDQLSQAISSMSDEVVNRLLTAITQTVGPVADSITQAPQGNHHGDGFGQDSQLPPAGPAFSLPPDAEWVNPRNPASGYFTPYVEVKDAQGNVIERQVVKDDKGRPTRHWNPTPEFAQMQAQSDMMPSSVDARPVEPYQGRDVEEELEQERARQEPELVGAGSGRRASKRGR